MRRGDLVTVALQGGQGKPRPALVVQADHFSDLPAITVLPITGTLIDAPLLRVLIEPSERNGLVRPSQVMVDKVQTLARGKLVPAFGHLDDVIMVTVNRALALFLGLACPHLPGEARLLRRPHPPRPMDRPVRKGGQQSEKVPQGQVDNAIDAA